MDRAPTLRDVLEDIRSDAAANKGNPKGLLVLTSYRFASLFARRPSRDLAWYLGLPVVVSYRVGIEWLLGVEIPAKLRAGPGLRLFHGQGLVVHKNTVLGRNVLLQHNTTIGRRGGPDDVPVIGDNVEIGANAVILGKIVVGDGARVGAGAVVLADVPPGSVVYGNPARVVEKKPSEG